MKKFDKSKKQALALLEEDKYQEAVNFMIAEICRLDNVELDIFTQIRITEWAHNKDKENLKKWIEDGE